MSENTRIEWCDHTFNPWIGCTKVSPGCDRCYAEQSTPVRILRARGFETWGSEGTRRRSYTWDNPPRWDKRHEAFYAEHGRRQRVFCASLADVFDNQVPPAWRADLLNLIADTPDLDWLLLTKRIGNAKAMLDAYCESDGHRGERWDGWRNVWLGASIVNREEMLRDGPKLKATPAAVHFWSVEPMLEDLGQIPRELLPGWVICGGESGHKARPMQAGWAQSLRDQCDSAGVPFFFKQWGESLPPLQDGAPDHDPHHINCSDVPMRIGKKAAGRLLDGRTHDAFPQPSTGAHP